MNEKEMAIEGTIIRCLVGSTIHGLAVNDGNDDRDEMGVCIEPIERVAGLNQFEQYIYRSAAEREQKHNAKSKAGDLDLCIYSLRKYVRLALKGNPTILTLLFVPESDCVAINDWGRQLQALAPSIVSRKAGGAFLGYLQAQKQRLLHERGGAHGALRPEYISEHGYDTKYAMHMLRLGYQGVELMETGKMSLPMEHESRQYLREIRHGKHDLQSVMTRAGELEAWLKDLLKTSPLSEEPQTQEVEAWMVNAYSWAWRCD